MKYMIMMFGSPASTPGKPPEWYQAMGESMDAMNRELQDNGELVDGQGLGDPAQAKTIRFGDGVPVATEGPFAEAKESLAGYYIVDVADEARAVEIASRVVAFTEAPMEIRPVMHGLSDM